MGAIIEIDDVTGINDLTFVGKGGSGILNIAYFQLSAINESSLAPTSTPTLAPVLLPLFPLVKAIDYDSQMGTRPVDRSIGHFDNNDYVTYNSLNFGDTGITKSILLRYSKGNPDNKGQTIELRIGGPDGEVIGEFSPSNSGSWTLYTTAIIEIDDVTGINDLTFVGKGGSGILNIAYFQLSAIDESMPSVLP